MSQWFRWFVGVSPTDRSIRLSCDDAFARDVAQRERNAVGWSHGRNAETRLHALVVSMSGSMSVQIERSDNTV